MRHLLLVLSVSVVGCVRLGYDRTDRADAARDQRGPPDQAAQSEAMDLGSSPDARPADSSPADAVMPIAEGGPAPDGPDSDAGCSPATCVGCCAAGQCVPLTTQGATQCGKGGSACVPCPSTNACQAGTCSQGSCTTQPAPDGFLCSVGPTVGTCLNTACCTGCVSSNQCQSGQSATACGTGGVPCFNCSVTNLTCSAGTCVTPTCGPCAGCCSTKGCVPLSAQSDLQCGLYGAQCVVCKSPACCASGVCKGGPCI